MQQEFDKHVHADPDKLAEVVKDQVEFALIRMTEKKIIAEEALEEAKS